MEERMTVCNMSIEAGARAGMIAQDETTVGYLAGRPRAPSGAAWERAVGKWRELRTDPGATYDKHIELDASEVAPQVTWGTSPGMVTPVTGCVPSPADFTTDAERRAVTRALEYMGLAPGTPLEGLPIDRVFLGSCTRSEEHTSELQSRLHLVCRLLLEKKKKNQTRKDNAFIESKSISHTSLYIVGIACLRRDLYRLNASGLCVGVALVLAKLRYVVQS